MVIVYGASTNPERYAYKATELLLAHKHELVLVGHKTGEVRGLPILHGQPELKGIDTMTLYVGPQNQGDLLAYALKIKPKRIIFNPGTDEFNTNIFVRTCYRWESPFISMCGMNVNEFRNHDLQI